MGEGAPQVPPRLVRAGAGGSRARDTVKGKGQSPYRQVFRSLAETGRGEVWLRGVRAVGSVESAGLRRQSRYREGAGPLAPRREAGWLDVATASAPGPRSPRV